MTAWIKIALRNLIKNWRRSITTALAIALGFASVSLFAGFTEYMYSGIRAVAIYGTSGGHLKIFRKGFLEKGQLDPARYLLYPKDIKAVDDICRGNPDIIIVTPQLRISGLASNGKVSTIFVAQGVVPSAIEMFAKKSDFVPKKKGLFETLKLSEDKMYGVGMARGMARMLDLKKGSYAVAFTNTLEGQMNALDIEVLQLFDTGSDMNDKVMRVTLAFARELYDTDGADRLAVLLDETRHTELVRDQLQRLFTERGLDLEVKTWKEMSQWYKNVKIMFDVIFTFLFIIVFFIVVMSVINTMSMAVVERTREIGTLRALGLKRKGVMALFAVESCLLGLLGVIWGAFLTFLGWWFVEVIEPTWIPPGLTNRAIISIKLVPESILYSFIFLMILCLIASIIPARKAARQNVVDALGHV